MGQEVSTLVPPGAVRGMRIKPLAASRCSGRSYARGSELPGRGRNDLPDVRSARDNPSGPARARALLRALVMRWTGWRSRITMRRWLLAAGALVVLLRVASVVALFFIDEPL